MANRAAGEERLQLQAGADPEHGSVEGPDLLAETLEHRRVVRRPGSVRAAEDDGFGAGQVTGVLVVDAFDRDPGHGGDSPADLLVPFDRCRRQVGRMLGDDEEHGHARTIVSGAGAR